MEMPEAELGDGTVVPLPNPHDGMDDVQSLAAKMTDEEMRALLIQTFRQNMEILEFARMMTKTMVAMGSLTGMPGRTARQILPENFVAPKSGRRSK